MAASSYNSFHTLSDIESIEFFFMGFGHTWLCGGAQQQSWAHMPQRLMATLPPFTFLNREAMAVTICQAILFFFFFKLFHTCLHRFARDHSGCKELQWGGWRTESCSTCGRLCPTPAWQGAVLSAMNYALNKKDWVSASFLEKPCSLPSMHLYPDLSSKSISFNNMFFFINKKEVVFRNNL